MFLCQHTKSGGCSNSKFVLYSFYIYLFILEVELFTLVFKTEIEDTNNLTIHVAS